MKLNNWIFPLLQYDETYFKYKLQIVQIRPRCFVGPSAWNLGSPTKKTFWEDRLSSACTSHKVVCVYWLYIKENTNCWTTFITDRPIADLVLNPFSNSVSIADAKQMGRNDLQYFSSLIGHCIQTAHKEILFHNFVSSPYMACFLVQSLIPLDTSRDIHAAFGQMDKSSWS